MKSMKDRIPVCPHGSRDAVDISLFIALGWLERDFGIDLEFSSGYRCKACNAAAGGVKNSAHLRGMAVDILIDNSAERWQLLSAAVKRGFRRIGIGRGFIHLDLDLTLPQDIVWLY